MEKSGETDITWYTRRKKQEHNTKRVRHHYALANTNNVNKT